MADRCRSCRALIVWAATETGRRMPVEPSDDGNVVLERHHGQLIARVVPCAGTGTHVSHFATCPNADRWRNRP